MGLSAFLALEELEELGCFLGCSSSAFFKDFLLPVIRKSNELEVVEELRKPSSSNATL